MIIQRTIKQKIEQFLFKGKVIVIYGARRVGKTTLCKQLLDSSTNSKYINCELLQNKTALETTNSEILKNYLGDYNLVILDEAQNISNIGSVLKIITDTFPEIQIIATGSSSFELGNRVMEPLTGRSRVFQLFPFSLTELKEEHNFIGIQANLEKMLRFGMYPEVFLKTGDDAIEELNNIAGNYLYKDILQYENLKRSDLLINLLRALALQIGHEISLNELSRLLGENINTIKRYIELLEKSFVIFRLRSFSRNLRNEIAKGQKIYFLDLGIRNALIQNFNPLNMRNDAGGLWENFCILERIKHNQNTRKFVNTYFWRTYNQKEIDYIEESDGELRAYEFKYSEKAKPKPPSDFLQNYPGSSFQVINKENFFGFFL
ncbi:MAG: ATP-binding protein [Bacteroidetes bacterium]|nr:ATP-binding protein [Bacteroidota bacterium]